MWFKTLYDFRWNSYIYKKIEIVQRNPDNYRFCKVLKSIDKLPNYKIIII